MFHSLSVFFRSSLLAVGVLGGLAGAAGAASPENGALSDLPAGHWAYDAVAQLVKDGLIVGYPNGTFKGNRPMTRYEAAVLAYRALDQIEMQLTAGKTVERSDIDAVKKLLAGFSGELATVEHHVDAIATQANDLKTEADATRARVNAGRLGFQILERPGTSINQVEVINGGATLQSGATPGNAIPHGIGQTLTAPLGTTFAWGPGGLNGGEPIGVQAHGTNYTLSRFYLGGQIDPRWSYGVRVSDKLVNENGVGNTTLSPSFCTVTTTTNCSFSDLNNFGSTYPVNLDYAYLQYSSPGGITSQIGRYSVGSYGRYNVTPTSLVFAGQQITGVNLGYNDPRGQIFAQAYVGIPFVSSYQLQSNGNSTTQNVCSLNVIGLNAGRLTSLNDINPFCSNASYEIGGWALFHDRRSNISVGGAVDTFVDRPFTFYNAAAVNCTVPGVNLSALGVPGPVQAVSSSACLANGGTIGSGGATGNYVTALGNPMLVEAYLRADFGPHNRPLWTLEFAAARHLGNNPFTPGASFAQANAYSGSLTFASKGNIYSTGSNDNPFFSGGGRKDSNVAQLFGEWYGLNSVGGIDNGNFTGSPNLTNNTGITNPNGLYYYGLEVGHWFSDNVRFSLAAFHLQNNANLPVGTNGTANTTCMGCFVNFFQQNQLDAEAYLFFF